jgi:hypothetical protein
MLPLPAIPRAPILKSARMSGMLYAKLGIDGTLANL